MENKLENTLKARERLLQHPIDASNIRNKTKICIVSFKLMYHWIYWFLTLNRNSIRPLQLIVLLFVVAMTSAAVNYDSPEELVGSSERQHLLLITSVAVLTIAFVARLTTTITAVVLAFLCIIWLWIFHQGY